MDQDNVRLTKKERKEIKRETEQQKQSRERKMRIIRNCFIAALLLLLIGGGLWWLIKESNKPLPGQAVEDLGRKHIGKAEWEKFKYNSNPPTSGPHDVEWIKAGIYNSPQGEGYLVHSLEHGYIIISYNCTKLISNVKSQMSNDEISNSKECQDLKKELSDLVEEQKIWKLIVVPRPNLDVPIAITAWTRIDKMEKVDKDRIAQFISSFRDRGPEQTMEP